MKPVFQVENSPNIGDCMAACIASILELNIEDVPNFRAIAFADNDECNTKHANPWLAKRNLAYLSVPIDHFMQPFFWEDVYCLCGVPSQRFHNGDQFHNGDHYVVGRLGRDHKTGHPWAHEIVHDPQKLNLRQYEWKEVTSVGFLVVAGIGSVPA